MFARVVSVSLFVACGMSAAPNAVHADFGNPATVFEDLPAGTFADIGLITNDNTAKIAVVQQVGDAGVLYVVEVAFDEFGQIVGLTPAIGTTTVDQPDRVEIADVDCDGDNDVIVLGATGQIGVHLLDENGEPGAVQTLMAIDTPLHVINDFVVADVSGDGKPDVFVPALRASDGMGVSFTYVNDGEGGFAAPTTDTLTPQAPALPGLFSVARIQADADPSSEIAVTHEAGDMGDGDAASEVLVIDYDAKSGFWLNVADLEITNTFGSLVLVDTADRDGDGIRDRVVSVSGAFSGNALISLFDANGDGSFEGPNTTESTLLSGDVAALETHDADGTMSDDAVLLTNNALGIIPMSPSDTIGLGEIVDLPGRPTSAEFVQIAGGPEVEPTGFSIVALDEENTLSFARRLSDSGEPPRYAGMTPFNRTDNPGENGIEAGDIDGDGDEDIISIAEDEVRLWRNQRDAVPDPSDEGHYQGVETVILVGFGDIPLRYTDLDLPAPPASRAAGPPGPFDRVVVAATAHDSDSDTNFILFSFQDDGTLENFAPDPSGTIALFEAITIADLDGDGDDDLAVLDRPGGLRVFLNDADGTFSEAEVTDGRAGFGGTIGAGVKTADLVGDAAPEVLFFGPGNIGAPKIVGYDGDGTFSFVQYVGDENDFDQVVQGIEIGDVDGDDLPDVLYTVSPAGLGPGVSEVRVFLNSGTGFGDVFTGADAGPSPQGIELTDTDSDGDLDVVVTNAVNTFTLPRTVSLLRNDGTGGFRAPVRFGTLNTPRAVVAAQLDGVNGPDLIVGGNRPGAGSENTGTGGVSILTNVVAPAACVPDVSGDGLADLLDFSIFQACFGGADRTPEPRCLASMCVDFDGDKDVDGDDYALFLAAAGQ